MPALDSLLAAIETSRLATTVGQSIALTGWLSALHLIGMTVVTGGTLVSSLRLLGVLLADEPVTVVTRAAVRGVTIGLVVSLSTGFLLVSPRASAAAHAVFFQTKMALLVMAAAFHFAYYRRVAEGRLGSVWGQRLSGGLALVLWLGVAVAGSAYILLE